LNRPPDKINLMIVAAGLGIGGAEVVIQRLAESFDRERFNLTICCIKMLGPVGEKLAAQGLDIIVLSDPGEPKHGYLTFLKLLKLIRARRIDVIHTHTSDALFDAGLCRLLERRVRLVHTFHFGNYPHRSGSRKWFERIGSLFADRLVAVGDAQRQQIIAAFGFRPDAVTRVWNGVAPSQGRDLEAFRARVGATERILIGVTATFIEQKGLFEFLEVASRLRDQASRVRFVIVGEGELRPRLESRRRELGLDEMVVLTGWMPHANECALPAFDIFFQPSLWEAMSIALLEAMAAAKPVVATRVGEAPHIIEDGVDGLLVQPRDVDGMVAALRRLIDDREFRRRLGDAASTKVATHFTVERMWHSYQAVYLDLVQGRPSSR
jgi:glycosyltransferase involved in cell wall biosynthesis